MIIFSSLAHTLYAFPLLSLFVSENVFVYPSRKMSEVRVGKWSVLWIVLKREVCCLSRRGCAKERGEWCAKHGGRILGWKIVWRMFLSLVWKLHFISHSLPFWPPRRPFYRKCIDFNTTCSLHSVSVSPLNFYVYYRYRARVYTTANKQESFPFRFNFYTSRM